jgi:hypothetical protein
MTTQPPGAATHATIECYLTAVATRLTGPARLRKAILAELHDGLLEAVTARLTRGAAPAQAAIAAIEEFGDPAGVAGGFAPELAAATARRVALTLASTGPLIGLLWAIAYAVGRSGPVLAALPGRWPLAPPWRWPAAPSGAWLALPLICGLAAIAGLATLLVMASTGRLARWLPARPSLAPLAAATVGAAAMMVDLMLLGLLVLQAVTRPASLAWTPIALAATASLARLVLAGRATRRCRCQISRAALP